MVKSLIKISLVMSNLQNCQYAVALNSRGQWCECDDLTPEERASWVRGQNAADTEWERRKNGEPSLTLAQELIERESAGLLMHC